MKSNLFPQIIASLLFSTASVGFAAPGDLDLTFGGTGKIRAGFGGGDDRGNAVAIQSDDKVVAAGYASDGTYRRFLVVRYNADGSLDSAFGSGGRIHTSFAASDSEANAVAIQADGKIVVAGKSGTDFAVARYHPDGSLDLAFGAGGRVTTNFQGEDVANAVAVLADGKILAIGSARFINDFDFALAQYNADGTPDLSFSSDGIEVTSGTLEGNALAFQSGGKFIVAGKGNPGSGNGVQLARYNADGTLDNFFGTNGRVFTQTFNIGRRLAIGIQTTIAQADKIVVVTGGILVRYLTTGAPDTSFGGNGIVSAGADNSGVFFQTSGGTANRIIVSGAAANPAGGSVDFTLSRYFLGGSPDTAFGTGGTIYTPVGVQNDFSQAARPRAGKIVVVGLSGSSPFDPADVAVVRYNMTDGSLDPSFDGDGKRADDFGNFAATARGVITQPDGKIIVAGDTDDFALMRYHPNGSLDLSFAGDGKVTTNIDGNDFGSAVALQPDGRIVVAGKSENKFAVARYNADGSLDPAFSGGTVTTTIGAASGATAVALQADGKIVVAGASGPSNGTNEDFAVARYLPNGMPDLTFGSGGQVVTGIGNENDQATALKLQLDGKILVSGNAMIGATRQIAVVRFNSNGSLDGSFGSFGVVATDFGADQGLAFAMALEPNGRIVVAGSTLDANNIYRFALVRYLANGSLDSSFDGDGRVITPIGLVIDLATAVVIQPDGKILAAGQGFFNSDFLFTAVRYDPNGALDGSFGSGGKVIVDVSSGADNVTALALDSSGRAVLAGQADGLFGLVRLQLDPLLKILSISRLANGHIVLQCLGIPNQVNNLQFSPDLNPGSFAPIVPPPAPADAVGNFSYDDTGTTGLTRRFYRLIFP